VSGEGFEEYCERARKEHTGRRAFIAACIGAVSKELEAERQARKTAWVARARLAFYPGDRAPCAVCKKYEGLVEAHHVVPLALQFDAGAPMPIHEYDWLCPTHHAAQHIFIAALLANEGVRIAGLAPEEVDALHLLNTRFVRFFLALPRWEYAEKLHCGARAA
jgi:hypothetical protein